MSNVELLTIFHYDGEFEFDIIHPQCKGGKQKMRYLSSNKLYNLLVNVALKASSWEAAVEKSKYKVRSSQCEFFHWLAWMTIIILRECSNLS